MDYSDSILMTEISETTLVFTTNKTLHERFTKKPRRCVFIINNGYTTKFRFNRLKDRVVFQNRKGLKINKRFSTYDQGNEKGIENKDAGNSSVYESNGELSSISDNRQVVFMPEDFKEDCSTAEHDIKKDDGSDGRSLKHSSSIKSDEIHSTIPDNRRVVLMASDFKEVCATANHDMEIVDGSDGKFLEHSNSNDKSDENLGIITRDIREYCLSEKHDIEIANGSDGKCLEHSSSNESDEDLSTITNNRSVVLMSSDFREDCSTARHDMAVADGSDGKCLEHSNSNDKSDEDLSTITNNRSVVLMSSDFREDCSTARHDIEIATESDSRCLEHFSSDDKSDEDLITITDISSVVAMPSDFRKDFSSKKHDIEIADGSDSRCLEYSSSDSKSVEELNTISDNASVVSMPSDFKDDCLIEKHDMEQDDESDCKYLNHSSSNHKWNKGLRTITDNKRVVLRPSNFKKDCRTVKHDLDDPSEPIIFKPYMLKSYNRGKRQSLSKPSSSKRDSSKQFFSKQKRYKPSKKDLDNEIDTYMAEIKFKYTVKSGDSSEDIDSFVNEYNMETEKCLGQNNSANMYFQ